MSEVRVHVRLGTLRIDYQGAEAFYEAHLEDWVAAAAQRGVQGGSAFESTGGARLARTSRFGAPLLSSRSVLSSSSGFASPAGLPAGQPIRSGAFPAASPSSPPAPGYPGGVGAPSPNGLGEEDSAASDGARSGQAPTSDLYAPSSPEFGRYLRRLGPESDAPDRHVLAFAFYLWNYERIEAFGLGEIAGCVKAIGRELPAGVDAVMEDLTDKRRLLEGVGPGRWRLAKKGENYVKTRLLTV